MAVNRVNVYLDVPHFEGSGKRVAGMLMKWQLIEETTPEAYTPQIGAFPFKEQLPDPSPAVKTVLDEISEILHQSRQATIDKLTPYGIREPKSSEVYAYFELFLYQNYGMNYNIEHAKNEKLDYEFGSIDEGESFLPLLGDYSEDSEAYEYFIDHISTDDERVFS